MTEVQHKCLTGCTSDADVPVTLISTTFQTVLCWNNTCKCIINWILLSSPSCDVIVLSSPAPILVRKAVHLEVLLWGYSRHPSEVLWVWKPAKEWFGEAQRNKVICLYYPSSIILSEVSQLPLQFNVHLYLCITSVQQSVWMDRKPGPLINEHRMLFKFVSIILSWTIFRTLPH